MYSLFSSMGAAVNERYTCCTYQALTKQMPNYCRAFDLPPHFYSGYTLDYCKRNDYQGYGRDSYDPAVATTMRPHDEGLRQLLHPNDRYVQLWSPWLVTIALSAQGDGVPEVQHVGVGATGLYAKRQVVGDYANLAEAAQAADWTGDIRLVQVTIWYSTIIVDTEEEEAQADVQKTLTLFFRSTLEVSVPLLDDDNDTDKNIFVDRKKMITPIQTKASELQVAIGLESKSAGTDSRDSRGFTITTLRAHVFRMRTASVLPSVLLTSACTGAADANTLQRKCGAVSGSIIG